MTCIQQDLGYVFLGPTLSVTAAKEILPTAQYCPPIQCGDLLRLLPLHPAFIAIIDGTFAGNAAVWHKEILLCLEKGITVYGASSMGALRAAELTDYGMIGIGEIYHAYRDGKLNDDDEVALLHTPGPDYIALTEPMVNIRATLQRAAALDVCSLGQAKRLDQLAKQLFYQQRTWENIMILAANDNIDTHMFSQWLRKNGSVDKKREDTIALLQHIHTVNCHQVRSTFSVPRTVYVRAMLRDLSSVDMPDNPTETTVLASLLAVVSGLPVSPDREDFTDMKTETQRYFIILYGWHAASPILQRIVHLWRIVECEMAARHWVPRDAVIQQYSQQFRRQRQLLTAAALQTWLDAQGWSVHDYHRFLVFAATFTFLIVEGHVDSLGIFLDDNAMRFSKAVQS